MIVDKAKCLLLQEWLLFFSKTSKQEGYKYILKLIYVLCTRILFRARLKERWRKPVMLSLEQNLFNKKIARRDDYSQNTS